MSSPPRQRTGRSSASATPRRATRNSAAPSSSAPNDQLQSEASQATFPSSSRLLDSSQSQSPLFMQSSPVRYSGEDAAESDGGATPRAVQVNSSVSVGGTSPFGNQPTWLLNFVDSSPIHYASSSSPGRALNGDPRSSSSALFVRGSESATRHRRSDIHSDVFGGSSAGGQRRRTFVDEHGMPVGDASDAATFSNMNPNTSDADAMGGNTSRIIWGTNVSLVDARHAMKDFLMNFQRKYRLIQEGELDEGMSLPAEHPAMVREYVDMMKMMLELGITPLNLDARNLKSYPPTRKLWHQLQAYPNEIIPIMDVAIKDVMLELAEKRMAELRVQLSQQQRDAQPPRARDSSSLPPMISSDAPTPGAPSPALLSDIPNLVSEVDQKTYNVRPFGLDNTINLRELNPGDMDKLVSVKGLVIRTTPIIPDMKDGKSNLKDFRNQY